MRLAESFSQAEGLIIDAVGDAVADLAAGASIEVAPRQILGDRFPATMLPAGMKVYVPFLPKGDFSETVEACRVLVGKGFDPVVHIAARRVASREQLQGWLAALQAVGVDAMMLIAGDPDRAAGPFPDTLAIFESGLLESHGFRRIGVAGHPEGHSVVDVIALDRALRFKLEYAHTHQAEMWVVSQFAFGSAPVLAWLERLRGKGFEVPVHVGVPGPASLKTLLAYAAYCGVEASARVLARRPSAARLLARWMPDGLVQDLAHYRLTHPETVLQGLHVYTFGGIEKSAEWLAGLRDKAPPEDRLQSSGAA